MINFKGFENKTIFFNNANSVILGGKNGFGKTTIFDAVELAFTNQIKRLSNYEGLHDKKYNYNHDTVPLAWNSALPIVKVCVKTLLNGEIVLFSSESKTSEIKNPLNFSSFIQKICLEDGSCIAKEKEQSIRKILSNYNLLNYVSQEDATAFLKCKDAEKTRIIDSFFNTDWMDEYIEKAEKAQKIFSVKEKQFEKEIDGLQKEQATLKKSESQSSCEYIKLCKSDQLWDIENTALSYEEYDAFLRKDGVLDKIQEFIKNRDLFNQWKLNTEIREILNHHDLNNIVFYSWAQRNKANIPRIKEYKDLIKPSIRSFSVSQSNIDFLESIKNFFTDIVRNDDMEEIQNAFEILRSTVESGNELQKIIVRLQNAREEINEIIKGDVVLIALNECPICGTNFKSPELLIEHVDKYKPEFKTSQGLLYDNAKKIADKIQILLEEKIVKPIEFFFNKDNSLDMYESCKSKNLDDAATLLKRIKKILKLDENVVFNEESLQNLIIVPLEAKIKDVPENINFASINKIYDTYVKYIEEIMLNLDTIEKKRNYLAYCWNKSESERYQKLSSRIKLAQKKCEYCKSQIQHLKVIKNILNEKRKEHLKKVVSEIEILFYIYTGRIMQDNFYGRGLFMKYSPDQKRVLFVTEYKSDVDALYNLSSGQLVAVIFSFILSLNQLYSKVNLLAIDDPIQTIDDINVWGFTETLRHSFSDLFLLLSTHEEQYSSLIRYKFDKKGMEPIPINMADEH